MDEQTSFLDANFPWQTVMKRAVELYIRQTGVVTEAKEHTGRTPERVVEVMADRISGYLEDPAAVLTMFPRQPNTSVGEMVHVRRIVVLSTCMHHLSPIIGLAHFAYVPGEGIVGLSKIPQMIDVLARRLQVQEYLTEQIVDRFQEKVKPGGCGVFLRAVHCCMTARGVREHLAVTDTTAMRGGFMDKPETRREFLQSIDYTEKVFP